MAENQERQGIRDPYVGMSDYNALEYIIEQKIRQYVNTSFIARVDGCTSTGSSADAGYVSATPLVSQTDADGNALPMASIPKMPHSRLQGGIAAIVIDPIPGDIGIFSACKADSSTVKVGTEEPQRPGSFRSFDQADSCLVATVSNKAPKIWLELKQDKKGVLHCPQGVIIETPEGGDGIFNDDGKKGTTHLVDGKYTVYAPNGILLDDGHGGTIWLKDGKCSVVAPNGIFMDDAGGGTITLKGGRSTTVAPNGILLDTPNTTITGNLYCTGEKGNSMNMTGNINHTGNYTHQGNYTQSGDYNQTGSHTSSGDQIAGGISQMNHTHTGVETGSGNTGTPQ